MKNLRSLSSKLCLTLCFAVTVAAAPSYASDCSFTAVSGPKKGTDENAVRASAQEEARDLARKKCADAGWDINACDPVMSLYTQVSSQYFNDSVEMVYSATVVSYECQQGAAPHAVKARPASEECKPGGTPVNSASGSNGYNVDDCLTGRLGFANDSTRVKNIRPLDRDCVVPSAKTQAEGSARNAYNVDDCHTGKIPGDGDGTGKRNY